MMHLPNEAEFIGYTSDDKYMIFDYKSRIRRMAIHTYVKPLLVVAE